MEEKIRRCVLQVLEATAGTKGEGVYLVSLSIKGSGKGTSIEVLVDTDTGIRIDQCAFLSRRIRECLEVEEESDGMSGDDFNLDVASPGLGKAIILQRQYARHVGRLFRITFREEDGSMTEISGHLREFLFPEEENASLVIEPLGKKKAGKKVSSENRTLRLDRVIRAVPEAEL
ncbi:MAG: ribosome maturation factor RimP [Chlorobium phaeobacteroides]|jgi:ribosome maturation factor RimP|nr:ribosome maturation factor RimP [Chlorobium phaeobacteroides]